MPCPNPRCGRGSRLMSSTVGIVGRRSGRGWPRRGRSSTCLRAGIRTPSRSTASVVTRNVAWGTGAENRMSSSTAAGISAGSSRSERSCIGMVEEVDDPVADQAGGGVVTGDDQLEQARQQLLLGEPIVVVAGRHEHADEIVRGAALDGPRRDARASRRSRPTRPRPRAAASRSTAGTASGTTGARPARSFVGHAEQLADHAERQRVGEALDEVDHRLGARGLELVEQLVGDAFDRRFECGDPGRRERPRHEAAQPRVVGRIDVQHVAGERGPGQSGVRRRRDPGRGRRPCPSRAGRPSGPGGRRRDPRTSHASWPSARRTWCTGHFARIASKSG